jgi:hypothetical protein
VLGRVLYLESNNKECSKLLPQALEAARKPLGYKHLTTKYMNCYLGRSYAALDHLNNLENSEELLRSAGELFVPLVDMALDTDCSPKHSLFFAQSLTILLCRTRQFERAEQIGCDNLRYCTNIYRNNDSGSFNVMVDLSWVYTQSGNYSVAKTLLERAIHGFKKVCGEDHYYLPYCRERLKELDAKDEISTISSGTDCGS